MVARPIAIGHADGRKVRLSPERRATHMHVMGGTGKGKSKFLEHCIREDILQGHGVCLIDPEGTLYDSIVEWLASMQFHKTQFKSRVHLFDPRQPGWRFRFNPLFVHPLEDPGDRVSNVLKALEQVWGGEDSRGTPAIRTTVRAILTALIERGYSMAEAFHLTSTADPDQVVAYLTHDIENQIVAEMWAGYRHMAEVAKREHLTEFGGSRRRFAELLGEEKIREVLSAYDNPIDFSACMDNGDIVLINLSPKSMGEDPARAFGALFVRELFYCAMRREPAQAESRPFYAYIDECGGFLTSDITSALARTRKRGFHVVLAHQWLGQLREQGEAIYQGVMSIQNKVIFGGLKDEDAVIMADELFRTEYDLELPVDALTKPGVVGYRRTWLNNWSEGDGESTSHAEGTSDGETMSDVSGISSSQTVVPTYDAFGFPTSQSVVSVGSAGSTIAGSGRASSRTSTDVSVRSSSRSRGASESLEPILEPVVGAVHGLENVRHRAVARLRSIPDRRAVVKGAATPSFDITTYDIEAPLVTERMIQDFTESVMAQSPYTIPADAARQILRDSQTALLRAAHTYTGSYKPRVYLEHEDDEGLG